MAGSCLSAPLKGSHLYNGALIISQLIFKAAGGQSIPHKQLRICFPGCEDLTTVGKDTLIGTHTNIMAPFSFLFNFQISIL